MSAKRGGGGGAMAADRPDVTRYDGSGSGSGRRPPQRIALVSYTYECMPVKLVYTKYKTDVERWHSQVVSNDWNAASDPAVQTDRSRHLRQRKVFAYNRYNPVSRRVHSLTLPCLTY